MCQSSRFREGMTICRPEQYQGEYCWIEASGSNFNTNGYSFQKLGPHELVWGTCIILQYSIASSCTKICISHQLWHTKPPHLTSRWSWRLGHIDRAGQGVFHGFILSLLRVPDTEQSTQLTAPKSVGTMTQRIRTFKIKA